MLFERATFGAGLNARALQTMHQSFEVAHVSRLVESAPVFPRGLVLILGLALTLILSWAGDPASSVPLDRSEPFWARAASIHVTMADQSLLPLGRDIEGRANVEPDE